ncbi:MAG: hypothetical protein O7G87_17450 [bacterium]|nr:hypothetical protein [bacterium]
MAQVPAQTPASSEQTEPKQHPVTARAIVLGTACVTFMAWGGHYTRNIGHTTKMAQDHLPWGVMVPFIIITVVLNKLIQKVRPQSILTRSELLVIFAMASIGSALPSYFMAHLLANIAAPYYFPTPENGWATELHPHLASWTVVTDLTAVRWFYEGLPAGASIPWGAWMTPLFWRLSLVAAIGCFCYCVVAILRKQWVEHERLTFPLMVLPMNMADREPKGFFTVGFLNLPVFWIGFGLAIFPILWNIIGYFVPLFPQIPREFGRLIIGREFPPIDTRFYPVIIGAAYFIELDISFSIIVFYLFLTFQLGFLTRLGFETGPPRGDTSQFENWQGLGALCVIIPWGLWMARGHLKEVFRKAFLNDASVDDSRELLPYRTAVFAGIASALYIIGWCIASGMSVPIALVFLGLVLIVWLGITRITIESGLISCRTIHAQFASYHVVGLTNWHPASMVAMALTLTWHRDLKTALMAPMANATKLFEDLRVDRLRLTLAVAIAVAVVAGGSAYYAIVTGYETGAFNYGGIYSNSVQNTFNGAVAHIRDPFGLKREMALWSLLGVATTVLTAVLRYYYPWWPLHPIGFVSATTYPANRTIFSIFIAWFAKFVILRIGGISLYRKATPFFLGLMLGYFTGVGISFVIDTIWFPERGHSLALY